MWMSIVLGITCVWAGFYVVYPFLSSRFSQLESIGGFVASSSFGVGVAAVVVGVVCVVQYNVVGDFLPACASLCSGLIVGPSVFDYINLSKDYELSNTRKDYFQTKLKAYHLAVGFSTLALGVIHFIDLFFGGKSLFI